MKIVKAGYEILDLKAPKEILRFLERVARTCYRSEGRITEDSASPLIRRLVANGHEAMLEHEKMTVRFICDRAVSHELVRHRVASFAQESTRYCNYANERFGTEITVIAPCFFGPERPETELAYYEWLAQCEEAETAYLALVAGHHMSPQEARTVLPNSLKTEVIVTANMREWRHILRLRAAPAAHPQMRELMVPLLCDMIDILPELFDDIEVAA